MRHIHPVRSLDGYRLNAIRRVKAPPVVCEGTGYARGFPVDAKVYHFHTSASDIDRWMAMADICNLVVDMP